MPELTERFDALERVLNEELVERRDEIRCALLALISGKTFFMVGTPGIAKSMLARRIHAYIEGGRYFDLNLDMSTRPEDLFGPQSLAALKADRWERNTENTLVDADWAMLDEFFAASSALLKALLRALNEREFRNGTEMVSLPLTTVFMASNEVPTEARLAALYDRLLIRRRLRPISGPGPFIEMLEKRRPVHPEPILAWDDVLKAQAQAAEVTLPFKVLKAVAEIRRVLAEKDIEPSDRRLYEAMAVVRAAAWRDGSVEAEPGHLMCLADMCWDHPDQIPEVLTAVTEILEPLISEADRLMRKVAAIRGQIRQGLEEIERMRLANELHDKVKRASKELAVLRRGVRGARQVAKLEEVGLLIASVSEQILTDLYELPVAEGT